jgi:hypothetical protein
MTCSSAGFSAITAFDFFALRTSGVACSQLSACSTGVGGSAAGGNCAAGRIQDLAGEGDPPRGIDRNGVGGFEVEVGEGDAFDHGDRYRHGVPGQVQPEHFRVAHPRTGLVSYRACTVHPDRLRKRARTGQTPMGCASGAAL